MESVSKLSHRIPCAFGLINMSWLEGLEYVRKRVGVKCSRSSFRRGLLRAPKYCTIDAHICAQKRFPKHHRKFPPEWGYLTGEDSKDDNIFLNEERRKLPVFCFCTGAWEIFCQAIFFSSAFTFRIIDIIYSVFWRLNYVMWGNVAVMLGPCFLYNIWMCFFSKRSCVITSGEME